MDAEIVVVAFCMAEVFADAVLLRVTLFETVALRTSEVCTYTHVAIIGIYNIGTCYRRLQ